MCSGYKFFSDTWFAYIFSQSVDILFSGGDLWSTKALILMICSLYSLSYVSYAFGIITK
jgi:hypothetical protein